MQIPAVLCRSPCFLVATRYDCQVSSLGPNSLRPPKSNPLQVFDVLSRSRAQLERSTTLGDALLLAQWRNDRDRPSYHRPGHHTLSVYLEGGEGTRLIGGTGQPGAPGRYCILPADHESHWEVDRPFRFLHLYLSGQAWADRVVRLLDAEPRAHTLEQCIYGVDDALAGWARMVSRLDWQDLDTRLHVNALSHQALDRLVLRAARPQARQAAQRLRGGLSSAARRLVLAYIEEHLDGALEPLSLGNLATLAHLSEFHFARMFRLSMGCSVQAWVTQRRMARAQDLLARRTMTLVEVAQACGLCDASHLNRLFRQQLGVTPLRYRQACGVSGYTDTTLFAN